jgi:poly(ADP-ribose) glycohydrolase ARH3
MTEQLAADAFSVDRAVGALLGTFTGDALGMPFEGRRHDDIPVAPEMMDARRGRGTYTDDTQMMIALAESLLDCGEVDETRLAEAFLDAFDPDRGYGRGTRKVFARWRAGVPVATAADDLFAGEGSRGNGGAMRIAPVSVRFARDPEQLAIEAARSARLTHTHPVGVDAAVVQAAAVGAAVRGDDILDTARTHATTGEMRDALDVVVELAATGPDPAQVHRRLGSSSDARESVSASLCAAVCHDRFEAAVRFAIRLGGDTDTTAAMTGAIVGARDGAGTIPTRWLDALEEGPSGRTYVEQLAARLTAASS